MSRRDPQPAVNGQVFRALLFIGAIGLAVFLATMTPLASDPYSVRASVKVETTDIIK